MTKLEKSIRKEMKYYRNDIRYGKIVSLGAVGEMPKYYKHLRDAYATINNGICEDINIYGFGDAYERKDYEKATINITDAIDNAIRNYPNNCTWDEVIDDIMYIVTDY